MSSHLSGFEMSAFRVFWKVFILSKVENVLLFNS